MRAAPSRERDRIQVRIGHTGGFRRRRPHSGGLIPAASLANKGVCALSHIIARTVTTAIVALFLIAPGGRAVASEAQEVFQQRCADCHSPREILRWARKGATPDERRAWMDSFLQKHYPPSDSERALIIDHIEATIAARSR